MISERSLVKDYPSLWRAFTPSADGFVRQINRQLYQRDYPSMSEEVAPERRGIVNELATETLAEIVRMYGDGEGPASVSNVIGRVESKVLERAIARAWELTPPAEFSGAERRDAAEQVRRLVRMLGRFGSVKEARPKPGFRGCGIVDACEGDFLVADTLIEIKAGERNFRSIDVRQVATYLALNHAGRSYDIKAIAIINPRVGIFYSADVDEFCFRMSGQSGGELLDAIVYRLCNAEASR